MRHAGWRRPAQPLVAGGKYVGLVLLNDALAVDHDDWPTTRLATIARRDVPTASPDRTVGQALDAMLRADVRHLPVVDDAGELRGLVTSQAILDLETLLDRLAPTGGGGET